MDCWYQQGCSLYQPQCTKTCHRYLEMKYLIDNCGMPDADKYIKQLVPEKVDLPAYNRLKEIKDDIVSFVNLGKNLYIVSEKFGNGKTTWSLKLLYKFFDEVWCGNGFKVRGYFIYVPELINQLVSFEFKNSQEYKKLKNIVHSVDLVVWDDIGSLQLTPAMFNNLSTFIDPRIIKGKSNIFTGNLLAKELQACIGNRLFNRVWDNSEIIKFEGRGRRA